jgi:hypothetical protein
VVRITSDPGDPVVCDRYLKPAQVKTVHGTGNHNLAGHVRTWPVI